jgi:hypothetical protein
MNKGIPGQGWLLVLGLALLVAPGLTGCASSRPDAAMWTAGPASEPTMAVDPADAATQAAWAARPAFVRSDPRTEQAYAFAMASPQVLAWMPCYCGCGAMGHGSNADCFFKPTMEGLSSITFEEHASYCGICVDTALMAKQMLGEGQSLRAIRDAVDARFGGAVPGTPTELPPA